MKLLRLILLALLGSLLFGLAVGTAIRMRLEKPVRYIGARDGCPDEAMRARSALAVAPLDVGHTRSPVLEPGPDEEQVG